MQPREYSSKHNKTLGIASIGIDIYLTDFAHKIINSTAVKDKQSYEG